MAQWIYGLYISVLVEGVVMDENIKMEFQDFDLSALGEEFPGTNPVILQNDPVLECVALQDDEPQMRAPLPKLGGIQLRKPPNPKPNAVMEANEGESMTNA